MTLLPGLGYWMLNCFCLNPLHNTHLQTTHYCWWFHVTELTGIAANWPISPLEAFSSEFTHQGIRLRILKKYQGKCFWTLFCLCLVLVLVLVCLYVVYLVVFMLTFCIYHIARKVEKQTRLFGPLLFLDLCTERLDLFAYHTYASLGDFYFYEVFEVWNFLFFIWGGGGYSDQGEWEGGGVKDRGGGSWKWRGSGWWSGYCRVRMELNLKILSKNIYKRNSFVYASFCSACLDFMTSNIPFAHNSRLTYFPQGKKDSKCYQ